MVEEIRAKGERYDHYFRTIARRKRVLQYAREIKKVPADMAASAAYICLCFRRFVKHNLVR